jgi:hypothetical protein
MHFSKYFLVLITLIFLFISDITAQMITGAWKGKIGRQKAELKIVQRGDSITGTSYYYESASNYRRYSIKGLFDKNTNEVVWWDDQLLEEKTGKASLATPGKIPVLASADFNCPGGGKMMLDGKAKEKENQNISKGDLHFDKTEISTFPDEWDFVIENYTVGANDPFIIDSIEAIAGVPVKEEPPIVIEEKSILPPVKVEEPVVQKTAPKNSPAPVQKEKAEPHPPITAKPIEKKFTERTKVFIKEIPLSGDSIELRFYDNAEVDGDSISLFLNDKLVFEHIRLTAVAYTIKLSVKDLNETNELVMVAENLGSIPPNTSYMVAIINDERYDARLASTEGSSAMIRLVKKSSQ